MREHLLQALTAVNIAPEEEQLTKLLRYSELLLEWNARFNLTSITAAADIAQKHMADSLLGMGYIPQGARCIDVGTGAGFPGIPLAIFRQDLHMTLLDSLGKRVNFLKEVVAQLGLNAECVHARAEDAARGDLREKCDVALSRAVGSVRVLAEYMLPFCRAGGLCLLYKGQAADAQEELRAAQRAIKTLGGDGGKVAALDVPWGERTLVLLGKKSPTPQKYPRRAGLPQKEPL